MSLRLIGREYWAGGSMTIEQFLMELRSANKKWDLHFGNDPIYGRKIIRCQDGGCPITTLCRHKTGKHFTNYYYQQAARELGLSVEDAEALVGAADGHPARSSLQTRLLLACGIIVVPERKDP